MPSALRDIAAFLDATPAGKAVGKHAAKLAARHHAHLVGVYGVPRDEYSYSVATTARGTAAIRDVLQYKQNKIEQAALEAGRHLAELAEQYKISSELRVVWSAGLDRDAALRALHCDLLVAAQANSAAGQSAWSPEHLWLATGIPLVLLPQDWDGSAIGDNIVIAWNRSRQARRAVADAMPMLRNAKRVHVLIVDGERDPLRFGEMPGANLIRYLARRGVQAELVAIESRGAAIAEAILEYCTDNQADLLIIGAYSRSRASERIFGGTTRTLLTRTRLPTLVSA